MKMKRVDGELSKSMKAIASVRMAGLEPSAQAKAIFEHYVNGELTSEQMGRAIDQHLDAELGPFIPYAAESVT